MRLVLATAIATLSSGAIATPVGPEVVPDRFISAWNTHDLKAFDALYTDDAVWVPVAEERTAGRAAIVAEFAKVHAGKGWAVRTTIVKKGESEVHVLKRGIATIFFHVNFLMDGKPVPGLERAMILVAVRKPATGRSLPDN